MVGGGIEGTRLVRVLVLVGASGSGACAAAWRARGLVGRRLGSAGASRRDVQCAALRGKRWRT